MALKILTAIFIIILLPCYSLSAASLIVTIEHYKTNNPFLISLIKQKERDLDQKRQKIYEDVDNADDSSRRTLLALLEILEWSQNREYRMLMAQNYRTFFEEFIIRENAAEKFEAMTSGGKLDVSLQTGKKKNSGIPMSIFLYLDDMELFSRDSNVYLMDTLILLDESFLTVGEFVELQMLFLKITRCSPIVCKDEEE